ncbi:MAG TPA: hypothetical protein VII63_03405 [Caulobacteraceae bacterium]
MRGLLFGVVLLAFLAPTGAAVGEAGPSSTPPMAPMAPPSACPAKPVKPDNPLCKEMHADCMCDFNGQMCHWIWSCTPK